MREAAFLKKNTPKWQRFETLLNGQGAGNPDLLADLFIQLTDDLSFARTNYPESRTTLYLNNLTAKVHQSIYRNKKEEKGRFAAFWLYELPKLFYSVHRQLLYSFIIFAAAMLIGAVSAAHDETFVRLVLSDEYVNMTLENIKKGDPMAVYKNMGGDQEISEINMFIFIMRNNVWVSFKVFAYGIIASLGTCLALVFEGIRIGAFQFFFYQQGLFGTMMLTLWIHGTLEISAIVIAGCAGIVMGNSLLFPGTYSRADSLKTGAKKGIKIIIGLVPVFILAAFLEGFVTRHTEWPAAVKLAIILASAAFILYYFVLYPIQLNRRENVQIG